MSNPRKISCQHCGRETVKYPRNLCWACYYTPAIRARYRPVSIFGRRGRKDFYGTAATPAASIPFLPGSAEKVEALADRAGRDESLFSRRDFCPS